MKKITLYISIALTHIALYSYQPNSTIFYPTHKPAKSFSWLNNVTINRIDKSFNNYGSDYNYLTNFSNETLLASFISSTPNSTPDSVYGKIQLSGVAMNSTINNTLNYQLTNNWYIGGHVNIHQFSLTHVYEHTKILPSLTIEQQSQVQRFIIDHFYNNIYNFLYTEWCQAQLHIGYSKYIEKIGIFPYINYTLQISIDSPAFNILESRGLLQIPKTVKYHTSHTLVSALSCGVHDSVAIGMHQKLVLFYPKRYFFFFNQEAPLNNILFNQYMRATIRSYPYIESSIYIKGNISSLFSCTLGYQYQHGFGTSSISDTSVFIADIPAVLQTSRFAKWSLGSICLDMDFNLIKKNPYAFIIQLHIHIPVHGKNSNAQKLIELGFCAQF